MLEEIEIERDWILYTILYINITKTKTIRIINMKYRNMKYEI